MKGFYFVTDERLSSRGIFADVKSAVRAGVEVVQYRSKEASSKKMVEEARALRKVCGDCLLLVNDRVDVCLASGADGVHLGQDDMDCVSARKLLGKHAVIGVTVHTVEEARKAEREGADYLGLSPIFATSTKKDAGAAAGIVLIKRVRRATGLPIVAIGGITLANAGHVIDAGADCVCAISAVLGSRDVRAEILKFQRLFRKP